MMEFFIQSVMQPLAFSAVYFGVALAAIGVGIGVLRWGLGLS